VFDFGGDRLPNAGRGRKTMGMKFKIFVLLYHKLHIHVSHPDNSIPCTYHRLTTAETGTAVIGCL
jgi:hypothetical protein